jgi:hypothetical protein
MENNFNRQAMEQVGDQQTPNIFFLSIGGNTFMMDTNLNKLLTVWAALPDDQESAIEDRLNGLLYAVERDEDGVWERISVSTHLQPYQAF